MDFQDRLKKAVVRGRHRSDQDAKEKADRELSAEEIKRLHSSLRLRLSEHIEVCFQPIPQHFPGFTLETVYGERGWGAACSRDDVQMNQGKRNNLFSRMEMTIRPFSSLNVVELSGKATIKNREIFNRQFFQELLEVDEDEFRQRIDAWVLEFVELYAAAD